MKELFVIVAVVGMVGGAMYGCLKCKNGTIDTCPYCGDIMYTSALKQEGCEPKFCVRCNFATELPRNK